MPKVLGFLTEDFALCRCQLEPCPDVGLKDAVKGTQVAREVSSVNEDIVEIGQRLGPGYTLEDQLDQATIPRRDLILVHSWAKFRFTLISGRYCNTLSGYGNTICKN